MLLGIFPPGSRIRRYMFFKYENIILFGDRPIRYLQLRLQLIGTHPRRKS